MAALAFAGAAFAQKGPERPLKADQFESAYSTLITLSSARPMFAKSILRRTWTAADAELVGLARSGQEDLAAAAVWEAAERRRPGLIRVFEAGLSGRLERPAVIAARGLGALGPSAGVKALLAKAAKNPHARVRAQAGFELGYMRDARSIDPLIAVVREGGLPSLRAAELLAWQRARKAAPALKQAEEILSQRNRGDEPQYSWGKRTLPSYRLLCGDESALPTLRRWFVGRSLKAMDMIHPQVLALDALGLTRGPEELDTFVAALQGSGQVRARALDWLLYFGDRRASPWIRAAAKMRPHDVDNARAFASQGEQMLAAARMIDLGKRGPKPQMRRPARLNG